MLRVITRALAGTGAVAALCVAAPALAGTPQGLGMSVYPVSVTGPAHSQTTFTFRNAGTIPETIRVQAVELRPVKNAGKAMIPYGEYDNAIVTPDTFSLPVGTSQKVNVTLTSPDKLTHTLAISATAQGPAVTSGASVGMSLSAKYVITGQPNPYQTAVTLPHAPVSHADGFPVLPAAGGLGLLLLMLSVALIVVRRRYRGQHV